MSVALTSLRYAFFTVSPCVAARMNTAERPAWKRSANHGVFHFGCVAPKIGGRYLSRPPTKRMRAEPISHAPTPPSPARVMSSAVGGPSQGSPMRAPAFVTAWLTPEMMEVSEGGSDQRSEIVPRR